MSKERPARIASRTIQASGTWLALPSPGRTLQPPPTSPCPPENHTSSMSWSVSSSESNPSSMSDASGILAKSWCRMEGASDRERLRLRMRATTWRVRLAIHAGLGVWDISKLIVVTTVLVSHVVQFLFKSALLLVAIVLTPTLVNQVLAELGPPFVDTDCVSNHLGRGASRVRKLGAVTLHPSRLEAWDAVDRVKQTEEADAAHGSGEGFAETLEEAVKLVHLGAVLVHGFPDIAHVLSQFCFFLLVRLGIYLSLLLRIRLCIIAFGVSTRAPTALPLGKGSPSKRHHLLISV
ncbi:hypothetical protein PoMZ_05020 [Pyricularia oryzae]|uniref:Uncharacterized protein n=1 Tax=Pyricularia oryzae TaxID=318829 RepID=A0A4P7NE20_PYROR|nr:hypothetical protein PoMZ_05020 [Pyricularia oryzae]